MTPFKAVSGVEAFQAWSHVDSVCFDDRPSCLANRLAMLCQQLYGRDRESEARAEKDYDKLINHIEFEIGDRVLLRSIELSKAEGKKVFKPWNSPYEVKERLGCVGYVIECKVGGGIFRASANQLRRICR